MKKNINKSLLNINKDLFLFNNNLINNLVKNNVNQKIINLVEEIFIKFKIVYEYNLIINNLNKHNLKNEINKIIGKNSSINIIKKLEINNLNKLVIPNIDNLNKNDLDIVKTVAVVLNFLIKNISYINKEYKNQHILEQFNKIKILYNKYKKFIIINNENTGSIFKQTKNLISPEDSHSLLSMTDKEINTNLESSNLNLQLFKKGGGKKKNKIIMCLKISTCIILSISDLYTGGFLGIVAAVHCIIDLYETIHNISNNRNNEISLIINQRRSINNIESHENVQPLLRRKTK